MVSTRNRPSKVVSVKKASVKKSATPKVSRKRVSKPKQASSRQTSPARSTKKDTPKSKKASSKGRSRSRSVSRPTNSGDVILKANEALALLKEHQKKERSRLTLFLRPIATMRHFAIIFYQYLSKGLLYTLHHKWTMYGFLPIFSLFLAGHFLPGAHTPFINETIRIIEFIIFWVGLGVLSSVGLGTGLHTGILFLFPFISKVCLAAEECKTLDFDTVGQNQFTCPTFDSRSFKNAQGVLQKELLTTIGGVEASAVTFFGLFLKVFWPCFLWGTGTAMGEIPPYAVSRAARLAGEEDEDFEEAMEASRYDIVNKMKEWMFIYLQKYGFWAILAFAAWPNMAFDLCGIACGHFLLPFSTFFAATFIGKALIKVNMQAMVMIVIFSDEFKKKLFFIFDNTLNYLPKDMHKKVVGQLDELMKAQKAKFHHTSAVQSEENPPLLAKIWMYFMILFIAGFAKSIVDSFAQQRQAQLDKESNKKWLKQHIVHLKQQQSK